MLFQCFSFLFVTFPMFSNGFGAVCKIYLGFLRFFGKVDKNTKNEFLGADCPSGWSGQTPFTPLPLTPFDRGQVIEQKVALQPPRARPSPSSRPPSVSPSPRPPPTPPPSPRPPPTPPERGVRGAQPPSKRKKRVYILMYIYIYVYPSGALVELSWYVFQNVHIYKYGHNSGQKLVPRHDSDGIRREISREKR